MVNRPRAVQSDKGRCKDNAVASCVFTESLILVAIDLVALI